MQNDDDEVYLESATFENVKTTGEEQVDTRPLTSVLRTPAGMSWLKAKELNFVPQGQFNATLWFAQSSSDGEDGTRSNGQLPGVNRTRGALDLNCGNYRINDRVESGTGDDFTFLLSCELNSCKMKDNDDETVHLEKATFENMKTPGEEQVKLHNDNPRFVARPLTSVLHTPAGMSWLKCKELMSVPQDQFNKTMWSAWARSPLGNTANPPENTTDDDLRDGSLEEEGRDEMESNDIIDMEEVLLFGDINGNVVVGAVDVSATLPSHLREEFDDEEEQLQNATFEDVNIYDEEQDNDRPSLDARSLHSVLRTTAGKCWLKSKELNFVDQDRFNETLWTDPTFKWSNDEYGSSSDDERSLGDSAGPSNLDDMVSSLILLDSFNICPGGIPQSPTSPLTSDIDSGEDDIIDVGDSYDIYRRPSVC